MWDKILTCWYYGFYKKPGKVGYHFWGRMPEYIYFITWLHKGLTLVYLVLRFEKIYTFIHNTLFYCMLCNVLNASWRYDVLVNPRMPLAEHIPSHLCGSPSNGYASKPYKQPSKKIIIQVCCCFLMRVVVAGRKHDRFIINIFPLYYLHPFSLFSVFC